MHLLNKLRHSVLLLLLSTVFVFAQETRSSLNGQILDSSKKPVKSAEITAVHTPTGTEYKSKTNEVGGFRIPNMNVGGPYKISVKATGYDEYTENDIELSLGSAYDFNVVLDNKVKQIEGVVITTAKSKAKTGAETGVNSSQLRSLPNVAGTLSDFVRVTPQVKTTDRQISIAGQNNRYNAIYVDGGVNNDVFGLSPSGTDGGQTGGSPFALEELDQLTVSIAPFDVKQSGFAGGAINATTKAGTNKFQGSTYYFYRNNQLSGKTANYLDGNRTELPDFSAKRMGVSLGGPIVKNKLFFFTTYEKEDIRTPKPFSYGDFLDQANVTRQDLDNLRAGVLSRYNYDIGNYDQAEDLLNADKLITRLDWNISDKNKLTLKYKFTQFDYQTDQVSSNTAINFASGSQTILNKTHYATLEWNSKISDRLSNSLIISGKSVEDDRDFTGTPFSRVSLQTLGGRSINFGSEAFSTANYLTQRVFSLNNNFEIDLNKHRVLIGTQHDYYQMNNLFIGNNFGTYTFNNQQNAGVVIASGLERFYQYYLLGNTTGNIPGQSFGYDPNYTFYNRSYAFNNPKGTGDDLLNDGASAKFDVYQMGYYVQDTWKPNKNLTLNLGLRVDIPFYEDTNVNNDYNNITAPLLEKARPGKEIPRTGDFINPVLHFSPRLGFIYNFNPKAEFKTTLRGGVGVFTSRVPLVWAGGAYNNTGANLNNVNQNNIGLNQFIGDVNNQYTINGQKFGGEVNVFVKDFKLPQRLKTSLGWDQKLPYGFSWTTDLSYDKVLNDVYYENINLAQPMGYYTGSDNRPRWNQGSLVDPRYGAIYLGSNTSRGYSYTISNTLSKKFDFGLFASFSYTYNDAKTVFDGTSSQNSSQWRNLETVNGKNAELPLYRSQFAIGNRLTALASYEFKWAKDAMKTTISLFYEGINGAPYSYIYGGIGGNLMNNDDSNDNALIYIPKDRNDINLVANYNGISADYQWQLLDKFISNDPYLSSRRGQYVERNSNRTPWSNVIDLRILQDFKVNLGNTKQNFQLSFDIFNLTNLLNKKWGLRYNNQNTNISFFSHRLIDLVGVTNNGDGTYTPTFGVNPDNLNTRSIDQYNNSGVSSSIWQMQLGIRYFFK